MTKREKQQLRTGLLFLSPWLLGFAIFDIYPLAASFYYSFTDYNVIQEPVWVGTANYRELFTADPLFWTSLWNTLYFTALSVPACLGFSILIAVLLNTKLPGMPIFRTIFFLPSIVPIVASAVLWMWVLNPDSGLVNAMLRATFGIEGPGWLGSAEWSKPSLVIMSLWGIGAAIVVFLAGLNEVPQSLYESADLDGAGVWSKFRHVTLPMLTPVILFNLIMGLIGSFQYFTQVYVMTQGRGIPLDSTMFYALYLYRTSFYYLRMGYGSAMAWILFLVILAATLSVLATSRKWVYYQGE